MSTKIAVVCEDPKLDRFIVQPVVQLALSSIGKPRARVLMVENPRMMGVQDVLQYAPELVERYGPVADAVVFVVDGDCKDGRAGRPNIGLRLRNAIARASTHVEKGIAVVAIQEVEVWALWGLRNSLGTQWSAVRAECHPKEVYFEPQLLPADVLTADGGRTRLTNVAMASGGFQSLSTGCPELATFASDLAGVLS